MSNYGNLARSVPDDAILAMLYADLAQNSSAGDSGPIRGPPSAHFHGQPQQVKEPEIMKLIRYFSNHAENLHFHAKDISGQINTPFTYYGPIGSGLLITPLTWACLEGNVPLVEALLKLGADPNYIVRQDQICLNSLCPNTFYVVCHSHILPSPMNRGAILTALLAHSIPAPLAQWDNGDCITLLHFIALTASQGSIDLSSQTKSDPSALFKALFENKATADALRPIIDTPCSFGGAAGETALIVAVMQGWKNSVDVLLSAGANPNALDESGHSALQCALYMNHVPLIIALLKAGADPTIVSAKDKKPTSAFVRNDAIRFVFERTVEETRNVKKPPVVKYVKPVEPAKVTKKPEPVKPAVVAAETKKQPEPSIAAAKAPPAATLGSDGMKHNFMEMARREGFTKAIEVAKTCKEVYGESSHKMFDGFIEELKSQETAQKSAAGAAIPEVTKLPESAKPPAEKASTSNGFDAALKACFALLYETRGYIEASGLAEVIRMSADDPTRAVVDAIMAGLATQELAKRERGTDESTRSLGPQPPAPTEEKSPKPELASSAAAVPEVTKPEETKVAPPTATGGKTTRDILQRHHFMRLAEENGVDRALVAAGLTKEGTLPDMRANIDSIIAELQSQGGSVPADTLSPKFAGRRAGMSNTASTAALRERMEQINFINAVPLTAAVLAKLESRTPDSTTTAEVKMGPGVTKIVPDLPAEPSEDPETWTYMLKHAPALRSYFMDMVKECGLKITITNVKCLKKHTATTEPHACSVDTILKELMEMQAAEEAFEALQLD